nr:hypothetical protein [Tanacetum cinerariifolium]
MEYKRNNVVGTLMNIPIFVGTFSILTDFVALEDMDAYRDEGMRDVSFGEPFLREVRIKTKWFKGMITIYNGNDELPNGEITSEQKERILELKRRYFEDYYSDIQYAVSIKEDTAYSCLHSPETTKENVRIKSLLDAFGITAAQVCVNASQLELVLLVNFNEKYTKCLLLLVEVKTASTKLMLLRKLILLVKNILSS